MAWGKGWGKGGRGDLGNRQGSGSGSPGGRQGRNGDGEKNDAAGCMCDHGHVHATVAELPKMFKGMVKVGNDIWASGSIPANHWAKHARLHSNINCHNHSNSFSHREQHPQKRRKKLGAGLWYFKNKLFVRFRTSRLLNLVFCITKYRFWIKKHAKIL